MCVLVEQECNAELVHKLSASRRQECLHTFLEHGVTLKSRFMKALLQVRCLEVPDESATEFAEVVLAGLEDPPGGFDALQPTLFSIGLPPFELAETLLKVTVTDRINRLFYDGKEKADVLLKVCESLHHRIAEGTAKGKLNPIIASSLSELQRICLYVIALQSPEAGAEGTSLEHVQAVRDATRGAAAAVKKATLQVPYWKRLECQYRNAELAVQTWGPDLERCRAALQNTDMGIFNEVIEKLPSWRDNLRLVTVRPIERELQHAMQSLMKTHTESSKKTGDLAALEKLQRHADYAAEMLRPASSDGAKTVACPFKELAEEMRKNLSAVIEIMTQRKMNTLLKAYVAKDLRYIVGGKDLDPSSKTHGP